MSITKPTGEQIEFQSQYTGSHVLDTYLEAAEKGGRTLPALLGDIFDATGHIRPDFVEFRVNPSTKELETRTGGGAWAGTGSYVSRFMGDWVAGSSYFASDYVVIAGVTYICSVAHTSAGSPDLSKFVAVMANATLNALGTAVGLTADRLPYFTSPSTASLATLTGFGRSLIAAADSTAARLTLGLGSLASASVAAVPALTMAGQLTLFGSPTLDGHAASKGYVDAEIATLSGVSGGITAALATKLDKAGGAMTGALSLVGDPTSALHASTKQYTDNQVASRLSVGSYTAADVMAKMLTVDGSGCGLDADLLDGYQAAAFALAGHTHDLSAYATQAWVTALGYAPASWVTANFSLVGHTHSYLPLSGGTISGNLGATGSVTAPTFYGIVRIASGNMHVDAAGANSTYINWFQGSGGLVVGNGTSGGVLFQVNSSGVASAADFSITSDRRLKKNIRRILDHDDVLDGLTGYRFDWKDTGKRSLGFIAQDVQAVLPELVHEALDGKLSVAYAQVVAVLVEAVKDLRDRVAALEGA